MSTVYEAQDEKLKRLVAVKVLHPHLSADVTALERFRREALSAAQLTHPNIVRVYDYLSEENMQCIIMEFVPGTDMEATLKRKGCLTPSAALFVMQKVALALQAVHSAGLLHRDVKPSNILIHQNRRILLSDFGLAKTSFDQSLTLDNAVAGTPAFMSPEQLAGKKLSFSSDIYAWAVTFHYLVSGRLPYAGHEFAEIVSDIQGGKTKPDEEALSRLPVRIRSILLQSLLLAPQERIQNGEELVRLLGPVSPDAEAELIVAVQFEAVVQGPKTETATTQTGFSVRSFFHGKPRLFVLMGVLLLVAGPLLYFLKFNQSGESPPSRVAPSTLAHRNETQVPKAAVASLPEQAHEANRESPERVLRVKPNERMDRVQTEASPVASATVDSGFLFVFCDPWANVILDGKEYGKTPMEKPVTVPAGRRILRLTNDFCEPLEDTLFIAPQMLDRRKYQLKPKPAYRR